MRRLSTVLSALVPVAFAASLALAPLARADEYVDRANALIGKIPDARRSDLIVLPLVAKMDKPPEAVSDKGGSILYDNTAPGWSTYAEWANKPAQRAVLDAFAKVTENNAYQQRMIFGLPYGVEGVPPELVMEGMYIELGDPPTLAAAKFEYFEKLGWAMDLLCVEANRLLADGKPFDALKVLSNGLFFCRQLADRESAFEKRRGMTGMCVFLEAARDIVYRDSRSASPKLTPDQLKEAVKAISERDMLSIERIAFANYDKIAGEQVASRIFLANGKINPATFAPTMSRIASGERPLRLFSEAGHWERVVSRHKGAADTKTMINNVANDYAKRWSLDQFDPYMTRAEDLAGANRNAYGAVHPLFRSMRALLMLRQRLRAEAGGTRMAMGVQAYVLKNKTLPPDFSAIRPAFVPEIELDPYRPMKKRMSFFVPIRDTAGPRGNAEPHEIRVFQVPEYPNFSVRLGADQFVIYAAGPDESADQCHDATQANPDYKSGDLLLWPPRVSLLRQYLTEQGLLK